MTMETIQEKIPSYAKDIKLNLSSLLNNEGPLTEQQFWGIMLASALASKNKLLLNTVTEVASTHLSSEAMSAAKGAAALMAMNNIYYRFTHLVSDPEYASMPANLRMSLMAQPGIDKMDFELFSLAVSAINGCGKCIDAHEKVLTKHGMGKESIQMAVRIASIISATALVLEAEL